MTPTAGSYVVLVVAMLVTGGVGGTQYAISAGWN